MSTVLAALAPFALGVAAGVCALLADAFVGRRAAVLGGGILLAAASVAAFVIAWQLPPGVALGGLGAGGGLSGAPAVVFAIAAFATFGGIDALSERPGGGTLAALIALGACGTALAAASLDIVLTLIAIETAAVAAYALVAAGRTSLADEASMRYFVQGSIATSLFVLGIAGVLSTAGATNLTRLAAGSDAVALPLAGGVVLIAVALSFKAGAFPFHAWVPDAYEGAPAESAAFLAAGNKTGAVVALAIVITAVSGRDAATWRSLGTVITAIAVASIVYGTLAALRQRSYTRMLAYAAIAQAGYAFVALSVFGGSAATVTVVSYAFAAAAAFLGAAALRHARPSWDGTITGMAGLGHTQPALGLALSISMLSLVGIPPLFGFWGKLQAFAAAVTAGQSWLAIVGLLASVISFGYYGAVLRSMYFEQPPSARDEGSGGAATRSAVVLAVVIVVLGLLPLAAGSAWLGRLFTLR